MARGINYFVIVIVGVFLICSAKLKMKTTFTKSYGYGCIYLNSNIVL